uniref:G-protein coupled receptors family 3 profile domain-containing protein n=1 Tax=Sphaeramia orbicularis TaxID=375764 RepID=A0A672Z3Y7_9TELE
MGWITVILLTLVAGTKSENETCRVIGQTGFMEFSKEGDLIIGGVFSISSTRKLVNNDYQALPYAYCKKELRFVRTVRFTVEEINRDTKLLPGATLGYRLYNGCGSENLIRAAVEAVNGGNATSCKGQIQALLGHSSSGVSEDINLILSPLSILHVSHLSTCACLSDKRLYPTFYRTVPSDTFQILGLVQLMKYFDWRWVGIIYTKGLYAEEGVDKFIKVAIEEDICVEYAVKFYKTKNWNTVINTLTASTAKVVLLFMSLSYTKSFLSKMDDYNITGKQWVGSEAWITQTDLASVERKHILQGALGFALPQASIPGLGEYLLKLKPADEPQSTTVRALWEHFFDCSFTPSNTSAMCNGTEDLRTISSEYTDVTHFRTEINVYKAVYSVAYALHALLQCRNGSNPTTGKPCVSKDKVKPKHVSLYDTSLPDGDKFQLLDTNIIWGGNNQKVCDMFTVPRSVCREPCPPGSRKAINKRKPVCCFDCFECPEGMISNQTDSPDCMFCPPEFWPNEKKDQCLPKPTEYLSYKEIMGTVLTAFSCIGVFLSLLILIIFMTHKETPIVKANNSELSFLLLFSLKLCFLCSLTFIGRPSQWSCMLRHTAFGITFVLCISCVLGKTIVVLMAFRATLPGSRVMKWFGPLQQRLSVLMFTLVQILICILWLSTKPPFPKMNMMYYNDKIILECALGSAIGFWAVLGYIGLLAVLCFILAFLARKLPDSFNEAKLITFSMLIFCAVWIAFIPAYVSSPGKFTVAVEIFAILASSYGLLICIFVPKCHIIIFRPEQNSRKHMRVKIQARTL